MTTSLLVATSSGWENARHQADVLAVYQQLRTAGVDDDDILLVIADDVASSPENPEPGVVRNRTGGPDLRSGAIVDAVLTDITVDDLLGVLATPGAAAADGSFALPGGPGDDLLVFVAGHGNTEGVHLGLNDPVPAPNAPRNVITPGALAAALAARYDAGGMRRALVVIEACMSGVFATGFDVPHAMVITAAGSAENSRSTNYDGTSGTWLADEFSFRFSELIATATSDTSVEEMHEELYLGVPGSHVQAAGAQFGDPRLVSITDFVAA
jgi:glycosylphosphatidylinositol transamidase (GPIT) subunit GPI8